MQQSLLKRSTAELIVTFGLVFAGMGAIVVNEATGGVVTHVGIGLPRATSPAPTSTPP